MINTTKNQHRFPSSFLWFFFFFTSILDTRQNNIIRGQTGKTLYRLPVTILYEHVNRDQLQNGYVHARTIRYAAASV